LPRMDSDGSRAASSASAALVRGGARIWHACRMRSIYADSDNLAPACEGPNGGELRLPWHRSDAVEERRLTSLRAMTGVIGFS
jgi:hypothetical protein